MSLFSGLKVKGHRRAKHGTPYERPKGVVDKVKTWLSPSSWAGYFGSTSEQSDVQLQTKQPLGELVSQSNMPTSADTPTSTDTPNTQLFLPVSSFMPPSDMASVSTPKVDSYPFEDDLPACSPDMEEEEEGILLNNSDDSWVAEDLGDGVDEIVEEEEEVLARPSSIALSGGSDVDLADNGGTCDSPLYTYQLGEGEANIVQHSSLLLTPGAEAPVVRVTNPFFANQLPRVPLQEETSTVLAGPSVSLSHQVSQTSYSWSVPRPIASGLGSQPGGKGLPKVTGNVVSTYTVTLTKPIMASTVARSARQPRSPSSDKAGGMTSRDDQDRTVFIATSVAATPSGMTTPSIDRSHLQATVSKSPAVPSSLLTRSSNATDESLRLSPFRSPFYSGRTAFGGAASTQKMRLKRQRSSVEPSICVPVRVRVQPSNTPDKPPSLLSSTAKKILDSLQSSSSPLKDARRLPMRQLSDEDLLPTKRRRVIDSPNNSIVSPPPVTPLRPVRSSRHPLPTPSSVPSLPDSSKPKESRSTHSSEGGRAPFIHTSSSSSSSSGSAFPVTSTMASLPGSSFSSSSSLASFKLPSFSSSTPKPASALSGLTFTPVLPTMEVKSSKSSDRGDDSVIPSGPIGRSSGKLRASKRSQQHFSRKSGDDEDDGGFINPLPPPPSVGLKLPTTASFKFHAQSTSPSDRKNSPATTSTSASAAPQLSQDSSSFSFSLPKVITSVSATTNQSVTSSFVFSVPKSHVLSPLVTFSTRDTPPSNTSTTPSTSLLPKPAVMLGSRVSDMKTAHKFNPKGPSLIKPRPPAPVQKQPLPLLSGSVEDVLKSMSRAEKSNSMKTSETDVTPISGKTDNTLAEKAPTSSISTTETSLASKFAPPAGSWECDTCMLRNEAKSNKCVACATPKPGAQPPSKTVEATKVSLAVKFAPPAGSWECGVCMVSNKSDASACVACSTPRPGSKKGSDPGLASSTLAAKFAPSTSSWECDTCMVVNKAESLTCVACTSPKPGSSVTSSTASSGLKCGEGFKLSGKLGGEGLKVSGSGESKLGTKGGLKLGSGGGLKLGSAGGLKLGSGGGLKLGSGGGLKFGSEGGLQLGANGGVKFGTDGGLMTGSSGGLKLGTEGGTKLGTEGGVKLGTEGGLKLGTDGGLKLGTDGGVKISTEGGVKIGTEGGVKLGMEGGLKLGMEGGLKLGMEEGLKSETKGVLKLGTEGGPKLGNEGGIKLDEGGLKQGSEGGLNLGSEGGLKLGTEGGLKFGQKEGPKLGSGVELKFGSGGLKLGSEKEMKAGSGGGLKLGNESVNLGGGLKMSGVKLGDESKPGSSGGLNLGGGGNVKLGQELKFGAGGGVKLGEELKLGGGTGGQNLGGIVPGGIVQGSSSSIGSESSSGGSGFLRSSNPGLFQSPASLVSSSSLTTGGLKLSGGLSSSFLGTPQPTTTSSGAGGSTYTSPSSTMEVCSDTGGGDKNGNGNLLQAQQLFGSSTSSGLGTGLSLKFGSAQSVPSISLGSSPFSLSVTKSSSTTNPPGLGGSAPSPFAFSGGNSSSSQATSQTSLLNNPLLPGGGSFFQASTSGPVFPFQGANTQAAAAGPPNMNLFQGGGSLLGTSSPATGKLQGLTFNPVGVSSASQPSLQFGSNSSGGLLGSTSGPSAGIGQNLFGSSTGFNFQSNQTMNTQVPPTFNFGGGSIGGSIPSANPSTLPASPVFNFGSTDTMGSQISAGANASTTTASRADLKRRVIKKAARRIKS